MQEYSFLVHIFRMNDMHEELIDLSADELEELEESDETLEDGTLEEEDY